jgi:hypothetical protein
MTLTFMTSYIHFYKLWQGLASFGDPIISSLKTWDHTILFSHASKIQPSHITVWSTSLKKRQFLKTTSTETSKDEQHTPHKITRDKTSAGMFE